MVTRQTEIRAAQKGLNYAPRAYGSMAGEPTVSIKLSKSDQKAQEIGAVDSLFDNWNWSRKLQNGFARLLVHGNDPLNEMHSESFRAIDAVLSCRFVDLELENDQIREPERHIKNMTDHYSLFVDLDKDVNWDGFEWFAENASSYNAVDYIFRAESGDYEDDVKQISRNYNIYDSDIWIYPKGTKMNTVSERLDKIMQPAKRNCWNVSPRLDIMQEYEEDDE